MQTDSNCRAIFTLLTLVIAACSSGASLDEDGSALPPLTGIHFATHTDTQSTGAEGAATGSPTTSTADPAASTTTSAPDESGGFGTSAADPPTGDGHETVDTGEPPEPPEPPDNDGLGCTDVDFLFVIDDSGSMHDEQQKLLASFPAFIAAIEDELAGVRYHVGVTTSSWNEANPPECQLAGALVSQTNAAGVCTPFAEGHRFATDQDDLSLKFPCIAQVGTMGSALERPVTNMIKALDPAMNGPGGCNAGFIRDDAILVVVIITDDPPIDNNEDDAHPDTDTSGWHSAVLAAKNDDPEALVVIGFVPWGDIDCINTHPGESPNLIAFAQSFGSQGVLASICEPNFGPVFADAVSTVVSTCENFPAPG